MIGCSMDGTRFWSRRSAPTLLRMDHSILKASLIARQQLFTALCLTLWLQSLVAYDGVTNANVSVRVCQPPTKHAMP